MRFPIKFRSLRISSGGDDSSNDQSRTFNRTAFLFVRRISTARDRFPRFHASSTSSPYPTTKCRNFSCCYRSPVRRRGELYCLRGRHSSTDSLPINQQSNFFSGFSFYFFMDNIPIERRGIVLHKVYAISV